MALTGLSTQTEFLPTVRFNAREGAFSRVDRKMDSAGNSANDLTDITEGMVSQGILIDVANIEIGWMKFENGVDITTQHHSLGLPGSRPSDWHKEGVKLELWLPQDIAAEDSLLAACLNFSGPSFSQLLKRLVEIGPLPGSSLLNSHAW